MANILKQWARDFLLLFRKKTTIFVAPILFHQSFQNICDEMDSLVVLRISSDSYIPVMMKYHMVFMYDHFLCLLMHMEYYRKLNDNAFYHYLENLIL